ncbi:hypothetical protein [Pedobacter sp.]
MALSNLNNTHLSAAEETAAKTALSQLETVLTAVSINVKASDRQKYGRINEQNKLFVNKVFDFHNSQPDLQTSQVEWDEFDRDYNSRLLMENLILRLEALVTKLKGAKILHDYDNYNAALMDYGYTNYMAGAGGERYENKLKELKQFFQRKADSAPKGQ